MTRSTVMNPVDQACEEAFWLGDSPRLWAMAHRPCDESGRPAPVSRAVVFCPPFAEEEKCSRRLYVDLARLLARRGVACLRFSYGGTADSEGEFSNFRVESARSDIRRALQYCREEIGALSLSTFGLRLGGTFALDMAGELSVDRVALWAPITSGRSYVRMNFRRKAIRQMINAGQEAAVSPGGSCPGESSESTDGGLFDFDGYGVATALWDELEAIKSAPPAGFKGEALVVSVGPAPRASADCTALNEALCASGISSRLDCVSAQPFWNLLGLVDCPEILSLTANWLARP